MPQCWSRFLFLTLDLLVWFCLPRLTSSMMLSSSSSSSTAVGVSSKNTSMRFGRFIIPSSHIFYRTQQSAAFVNLRPIVPGHVLVMPHRIVATMDEMTDEEYVDLWKSVRVVQRVLKEHYRRTTDMTTTTTISAFNVAVQDGRDAGQSVPHVHVHILPRTGGEFERNDDIYDKLEEWAPRDEDLNNRSISVPDDTDRVDRTNEQMAEEAFAYRQIVESGTKPNDDNNDNAKEGSNCLK